MYTHAVHWLDLTMQESGDLFKPRDEYAKFWAEEGNYRYITAKMAVETLRRFAETGVVEWRREE